MAYDHTIYEVRLNPSNRTISASGTATTLNELQLDVTGEAGRWRPGYVPHIIKGIAVMSSATVEHDAAVHLSFRSDITLQGTPTEIAKIVLPTAGAIHKSVYFTPTRTIEIQPGQSVFMNVTAAATSNVDATVVLYVQPRWETPANVTGMLQTT